MESTLLTNSLAFNPRFAEWLHSLANFHFKQIHALAGDAGFRRYYRVYSEHQSYIAMDASHSHENCAAFVSIAQHLRAQGFMVPEIIAADLNLRFLLLSDLGEITLLRRLTEKPHQADQLYSRALTLLLRMQAAPLPATYTLPDFNAEIMQQEWVWHKEWVITKFLNIPLPHSLLKTLDECMEKMIANINQQPKVFMHRDYHAANIMCLNDNVLGVLDFQDAFLGPITYDLVSLVRDCYIDWPTASVNAWLNKYKAEALAPLSHDEFMYWVNIMGVQRHLKAILTFARKKVRDNQAHYLEFIPRTINYLLTATNHYPELTSIKYYLQDYFLNAWAKAR